MKIKPFKIFDSLKTDRWVTLNKEYEVVNCHNHYVFYDDRGGIKAFSDFVDDHYGYLWCLVLENK